MDAIEKLIELSPPFAVGLILVIVILFAVRRVVVKPLETAIKEKNETFRELLRNTGRALRRR